MRRERLDLADAVDKGAVSNGHAPDGKFQQGNKAGASRRSRAAWRAAFDEACSPDDLREIAARAVRDAKKGDRFAREIVFAYSLQKPPRLIDVQVAEVEPLDPTHPANHPHYYD